MARCPKIRLSRLREIGWRVWDPIGIVAVEGGWEDGDGADEYDRYLRKAAVMVREDAGDEAATRYLVWVEREHMGLGVRADTQERARATIAAIRADAHLWQED